MIGQTNAINSINGKYEQLVNYTMLYDNGNECIDITGGWEKIYQYGNSSLNGSSGIFTKNDTSITIQGANKSYGSCGAKTINKVKNTGYSRLGVVFNYVYPVPSNTNGPICDICFFTSTSDTWNNSSTRITLGNISAEEIETPTMRLCNFYNNFGEYILGIYAFGSYSNTDYGVANFSAVALFKEDDWQTLANIAAITANSVDDILINSNVLLSSKEAIEFMIKQCTGDFMASAVASETFLTALNNSQYKTKIMANEHWAKFLSLVA